MKKFFKFIGRQISGLWHYFVDRTKNNIPLAIITFIFGAFCLGSAIYFCIVGRSRDIALCICYFLVVPAFYVVEYYLKIKCPTFFAFVLYVFILSGFIGACYNVYTYIPDLDNISHAIFGVFFVLLGIAIMKVFIGEPKTKKQFFACILFAIGFSMIMAVAWELFEFTMDQTNPSYDMQEDTIVNSIRSFYLYPEYDHLHTEMIDGIAKTVLYDASGNIIYTIEGGYLDIGIIDTMWDIIWCTVSTVGSCVLISISWLCGKKKWLYNKLVPTLTKDDSTGSSANVSEQAACVDTPSQSKSGERSLAESDASMENTSSKPPKESTT